jgi:ribosomal protein L11 methyltransferase
VAGLGQECEPWRAPLEAEVIFVVSDALWDADRMMPDYLSLSIEVPRAHVAWLSARLLELGFSAFEEKPSPGGVRILIYDTDERRLCDVQAALSESSSAHWPRVELAFELERPGSQWALLWTSHLEPVQLTPSLMLFPHAPAEPRRPGQLFVKPAFAFGFGEHASTRLVAGWLEAACRARAECSVLDVGCGTGVLALVALASGAGRVLGLDTSAAAVEAARDNVELNQLGGATFTAQPLSELTEVFDPIVANIEAGVLSELADGIAARLKPGGQVALAGFIEEQVDGLMRRYRAAGLELALGAREGAWCLLVGRRAS